MCDLDHFKSVNDTYGHQAGDEVLKQLRAILKDEAREIDRVGRYGGEEFMLLLPGTVLDAAVTFAERVRKRGRGAYIHLRRRLASPHGELRRRGLAAPARSRTATRSCGRPTTRCTSPRRRAATASSASTATNSTRTLAAEDGPDARRDVRRSKTPPPPERGAAVSGWTSWHGSARASPSRSASAITSSPIVDILQEISSSLHFVDVLQTIARKLGEAFGLDRCSIFLSGDKDEVRLVASYEDPTIRNLVVDLNRYPELKRAFEIGRDGVHPRRGERSAAPEHQGHARDAERALDRRRADPVAGHVIGAIFLRTERDAEPFSDARRAVLPGRSRRSPRRRCATRTGSRRCSAARRTSPSAQRRAELQRVALVGFMRRLLDRYAKGEEQSWAETLLPKASDEELERLVTVAMQVLDEEAKG